MHRWSPCSRSPASAAPPQPSPPSRRRGETGAAVCSTSAETWPRVRQLSYSVSEPSNHQPHQQAALVLTGILGALVPCCLDLSLAHHFGECLCLPLLPGSTFAMRVGIRERYKIRVSVKAKWVTGKSVLVLLGVMCLSQQGSVCEDWTTVYCCYPLAVCQMIREVKRRMKTQIYHVTTALECSWKHSRRWKMKLLMEVRWNIKPVLQHFVFFFSTSRPFFLLVSVVIWYCIFTYLIK